MDIKIKNKIVEKIIKSDDEILLNEIKSLVGLSDGDFWNELPDKVKQSVDKARGELDRGEGVENAKVMEEVKGRFLNK